MQAWARRLVDSRAFQIFIITLIVANAITIGFETVPSIVDSYGDMLLLFNHVVLAVFIVEIALKLLAEWPRPFHYFRDGWNVFDFLVVALSLVPATGEFAMAARLIRLLRVFRLVSTLPELRLIVATLVRSVPGMANVIVLMSIIFYVYGVMGYHLFHEHDPEHWSSLGISLLTLFRVVTLEDWTDVMYTAMELHPMAWVFFVSFVVVGTFVIINLFIAVVINNLDAAKQERLATLTEPGTKDELLRELRETQAALARVERRLQQSDVTT